MLRGLLLYVIRGVALLQTAVKLVETRIGNIKAGTAPGTAKLPSAAAAAAAGVAAGAEPAAGSSTSAPAQEATAGSHTVISGDPQCLLAGDSRFAGQILPLAYS